MTSPPDPALATDVHQHLWLEPLVSALSWRRTAPRVRRARGGWVLRLHGEPDYRFDLADHDPAARIDALTRDGVQRALLAISSPLGIEALPRDEAEPLLVHPGPAPWNGWRGSSFDRGPQTPAWWPAMTRYVEDMNAAWHAFAAFGRPWHPRLRVVFAMLAGGAPLHGERLAARGGPSGALADPDVFYDTSSYGARTIDAVVRCVGIDQLVYGSDRPVVDVTAGPSTLGDAAAAAMVRTNVARLLGSERLVEAAC